MSMKTKIPSRTETIKMAMAVRDAYLSFDHEDYCDKGFDRCGKCMGCIEYANLKKAYKIALKYLPR